ncbi:MAG TPA: DUF488 domain-containing protein [Gemmatimonadales bacterium]|nr:DUF488 domain-containing protein [Gemmatimonadales bacterium]
MPFAIKRVYDPPAPNDGRRILVDRLWPRGVTKARAEVDEWLKEIAPSTELRRWFHADPSRWAEFRSRYRHELGDHAKAVARVRALGRKGRVTLLYGARDPERNHAVVLMEHLRRR